MNQNCFQILDLDLTSIGMVTGKTKFRVCCRAKNFSDVFQVGADNRTDNQTKLSKHLVLGGILVFNITQTFINMFHLSLGPFQVFYLHIFTTDSPTTSQVQAAKKLEQIIPA